jgi:hypothetical protein
MVVKRQFETQSVQRGQLRLEERSKLRVAWLISVAAGILSLNDLAKL